MTASRFVGVGALCSMSENDPYYLDKKNGELQNRTVVFARSVRAVSHSISGCSWVDRKLVDQMCRSGTSIGANIREAKFSESNKDFLHKLKIAEKELAEFFYWLGLPSSEPALINDDQGKQLFDDAMAIRNFLRAAILTMRRKLKSPSP